MGSGGVGERESEDRSDAGRVATADQRPRARGQTVWETPRGVGLTPKTQGVARATRSPLLSALEGASPGGWSTASGSLASPMVDGQREMLCVYVYVCVCVCYHPLLGRAFYTSAV
ncbi:unnamed protein product [Scytosiphon promiscuus]